MLNDYIGRSDRSKLIFCSNTLSFISFLFYTFQKYLDISLGIILKVNDFRSRVMYYKCVGCLVLILIYFKINLNTNYNNPHTLKR